MADAPVKLVYRYCWHSARFGTVGDICINVRVCTRVRRRVTDLQVCGRKYIYLGTKYVESYRYPVRARSSIVLP